MQVFIVGAPLETAMALDAKRLNKQIIECQQILDALNGKKAWSNHPCTLQYRGYGEWLVLYLWCLQEYQLSCKKGISESEKQDWLCLAREWSDRAFEVKPPFHTQEYFDQMKRRLYTKNPEHYKQWAHLGCSDENWYWSLTENKFIKYINGKRVE